MDTKEPTFERYAVTVLKRSIMHWGGSDTWFALASYFAIAILALAGIGVIESAISDAFQRVLSWIAIGWLLLLMVIITPFRMWAEGQEEVAKLKSRFDPVLRLTFDPKVTGCRVQTNLNQGPNAIYYRVRVEYLGTGTLSGCFGRLVDVTGDNTQGGFGNSLPLPFAASEDADATSKVLISGTPEFLDIGFITQGGAFHLKTVGGRIPNSISKLFSNPGSYRLRVQVASSVPNTPTETINLVLNYTKDWQTTEMTCPEENS
ncbi:hypothetical protein L2D14_16310 [Thalassospiraceae bacterium LMO-JJ14]|nr:hypothetical protein L2D14_16310 [Thalassospiraceae bacterium LMO-JJ14]